MPRSQRFDGKQVDSRQKQLEGLKMFFDRSNVFAIVQEPKTRGSKVEDKRPHNNVRVECWGVDHC